MKSLYCKQLPPFHTEILKLWSGETVWQRSGQTTDSSAPPSCLMWPLTHLHRGPEARTAPAVKKHLMRLMINYIVSITGDLIKQCTVSE